MLMGLEPTRTRFECKKGLDLTFRQPDHNMCGGILIKTMEDLSSETTVQGSCICATELLRTQSCEEIKEFVSKHSELDKTKVLDSDHILHQNPCELPKREVTQSHRMCLQPLMGLTLKKTDCQSHEHVFKPNHYHTLQNKMKKGEPQIIIHQMA